MSADPLALQRPIDGKPLIRVACGVVQRPSGEVLFTQRPVGKIAAGWWEFPGGKIESGEQGVDALGRELEEELGVAVRTATPLIRFRHDYSNRSVLLDTWRVTAFDGEPQSREAQDFLWLPPEQLAGWPQALPTVTPIVRALTLPPEYVFTRPDANVPAVLAGLPNLPTGALLRLRWPVLSAEAYRDAAKQILPAARAAGLRVILDRAPTLVDELGADGWHATSSALAELSERPLKAASLMLASVHRREELQRAAALGCDAAVLGTVQASPSHPEGAALGWSRFEEISAYAGLPVYAIGGVGSADGHRAITAWGQGVAGISAYWS